MRKPVFYKWQILWILLLSSTTSIWLEAQQLEIFKLGEETNSKEAIFWEGTISSSEDNEPVINAVILAENGINTVSDLDGKFRLKLKKRTYNFTISALGFEDKQIQVIARSSGAISVQMNVESVLIDEIIVSGRAENQRITEINPGLQRLNAEQLDVQSKFFGEIDILRSLQSISGVNNTGEGASGFNVRGGNTDQNLILQDGHLLFNPSHALGFFSIFHPDLVQYLDLYKGGIPAKYGGRLSSVLSVQTRDGNKQQFKARGGIGMVSSRLSVEGPIVKDKVSYIIGGRYSYADWIFGLVDNPAVNASQAFFNDVTAKINARLSNNTNLGFSILRSEDDFQLGEEARFDYSTLSGEAYLKQIIGDNLNLTLSANKGRYQSSLFDLKGNDRSKFTNFIDYTRGKLEALYVVNDQLKINAGGEVNLYDISPGAIQPLENSFIIPDQLDHEKGREIAGFLEAQLALSDKAQLSVGARYTTFANVGPSNVNQYPSGVIKTELNILGQESFGDGETIASYSGFEPRASLRYSFDDFTSVKLGYARTYQFLAQISNTASATPIDIWQLSNTHLEPQVADNYSVGFFKNFGGNRFETSIEGFYRTLDGIIDYKDFAELLLNRHIETELVVGDGRTYGLELNLKKQFGTFRWDANYTYSTSQLQIFPSETQTGINRGEWYSANYDIPHVMNLNMVKQFKKSNFSVNFTFRSGRPTTAPISSYTNENVLNIPIYSDRNQFRVPNFHRLDIAYTIGPFGKPDSKFEQSVTLSVYNLYSRKNAYSVYFRQNPFDSVRAIRVATLGTIFPSITYNFELK